MVTLQPTPAAGSPAGILGVGGYRPARVVGNDEVCRVLDSSDDWIVRRSGIRTRRRAGADETLGFMAWAAAAKALAAAGVEPSGVDRLIVATMSRLEGGPPLAVEVAERLSARHAAPVDVSAACAGFSYALALARDAVLAGTAGTVVVVGTERMLDIVDPRDRSTAFLFGDGAGAMVVGRATAPGIGPVCWGGDGSRHALISRPVDGWGPMRMDGPQVFRWALAEMPSLARRAMDRAGVRPDELGAFIPHQANLRIVDGLARALGLPDTVAVARDVVDAGNTSAASIPLAAERLISSGQVAPGALALTVGFGAGLAYAAQVIRLP